MANKIDSNIVGLSIAEEAAGTPGVLPVTPVWYAQEPNSFSDFGGNLSTVARDTINASRQRQKGTATDFDASGGFNTDVTQNNLTRLMQGFLFADAHEKADTQPLNGSTVAMTAATSTTYTAASGLGAFRAGDLVLGSGFGVAANNGLKVLSVATGTTLTTTGNATEASPPAAARVQSVGFQFASGDATMTVASGQATLGATTKDLTQLGLQVGEWVYVGGDASSDKFATCPNGYARVASVSAAAIVFDKVGATFVTDTGTGKTLRLFFGTFIRNEKTPSLIKTRTYQLERTLGNDGSGVQSEYLEGAVANEFTMNLPTGSKLAVDLGFIATAVSQRDGTTGVKSGTRVDAFGEDAFNTSSKVVRTKMNVLDPLTLEPTPLFAYITEATLNISNNASLAKAVGVLGAIDTVVGNFAVGGSITAYFTTVDAIQAVYDNSDVTMDFVFAQENAGMVYDIPLMSLGNGRVNVTKDQAITIPLEMLAAEGANGYTLGINSFAYLPTAAMPS